MYLNPALDVSSLFLLQGFFGERKGEREDMQDAHLILNDCTPCSSDTLPNNRCVRI